MIRTKTLLLEACRKSKELYEMTDTERLRLQEHLRRMYIEIEKVCDAHGLQVMVAYGTLLGAIRHKGFIPWDDDIDLFLPREDYNKFIHQYAKELPKHYKVYAPNSPNGALNRFAKVVDTSTFLGSIESNKGIEENGFYVDIFPLENVPIESKIQTRFLRIKACLLMYIAGSVEKYYVKSPLYKKVLCSSFAGKVNYYLRNFIGFLFHWKSEKEWFDILDRFLSSSPQTGYFMDPTAGADLKYFLPQNSTDYLPRRRAKFDDIEVYIPHCPEKLLNRKYPNWNEIPAPEKRECHYIASIKFHV